MTQHPLRRQLPWPTLLVLLLCCGCASSSPASAEGESDWILRGGTIIDGSGSPPFVADVAFQGDRLVAIGDLSDCSAKIEVDVSGLVVCPGFINMLSWGTESLLHDGRGLSDICQGVTLEVFGEGWSMGPLNETMKADLREHQGDLKWELQWTTLGEYLEHLEHRGVSPNVASFVGATTIRIHELGYEDRPPTKDELDSMRDLVRQAMEEGALGLGSSLIYAPAFYADTQELIALAEVAAQFGGLYISHLRSEGNQLLEALDELLTIARTADLPAEIYHLKAAGQENWSKLDEVITKVEAARSEGLAVGADMYTYTAGATGLDASMPPWVQEGGLHEWVKRLQDANIRAQVMQEMKTPSDDWENLYLASGPEKIFVTGFKNPDLKKWTGQSLAQLANQRGESPEEVAINLVIEDGSRVECVYFLMSEENIRQKIALPWVSFCSDASALANEGVFLESSTHPRAYGTFARLLGRYVRDEKVISLPEAIHRLTHLPARRLKLENRGLLTHGYFADVVVFDPDQIQDHATFESPHQYATGVRYVFVNGEIVFKDGKHTGAKPGRFVRGPGWQGKVR